MQIIKHSSCNDELGVSDEQAAQGVVPLPITRGVIEFENKSRHRVVRSFWKPTAEELVALNAGHPVLLQIFGNTHAPVCVLVADEKE